MARRRRHRRRRRRRRPGRRLVSTRVQAYGEPEQLRHGNIPGWGGNEASAEVSMSGECGCHGGSLVTPAIGRDWVDDWPDASQLSGLPRWQSGSRGHNHPPSH